MVNHPLNKFHYCPCCGSNRFVEHDFKSKQCLDCGFTYYFNAAASTAAFIVNNSHELLVATRAKEPSKGTLDLPGGFVDLDETGEEAMVREIKEETGMAVKNLQYLFSIPNVYPFSGLDIHTMDLFFLIRLEEGQVFCPMDDVATLQWIPLQDIQPEKFGLNSIRQGVIRFLQSMQITRNS